MELPYKTKSRTTNDTAIPLIGIYQEKNIIWKDTCTPMFTAALFTRARTWKQPKCASTGEWIKMWYIFTMDYYSAIKKNKINAICSNMDGPRDCHTEWSQTEKDKYSISYMWNLKKGCMGKESKKTVDICICITDSLCCTPEPNTLLYINCNPIKFCKCILNINFYIQMYNM